VKTRELVVAGAALLFLGYAFGRYSVPDRIVERTVQVTGERAAETTQSRERDAESVALARTVIVETTTRPDGTVTVTETDRTEAVREVVREVEVVRTVEVERVVVQEKELLVESPKPAWRVALDLGVADAPHRLSVPGIPRAIPVVAHASLERRVIGPVSAGVWVGSTPAAGLRVSIEF